MSVFNVCGEIPLWYNQNDNTTSSSLFRVTKCFRKSVLILVPLLALWIPLLVRRMVFDTK